jgi:hypothetical protein
MLLRWLLLACALALPTSAHAQTIVVQPYLQDVTTTSAWILWETSSGEESRVEFGLTDTLGTSATGTALTSEGSYRVHEAQLTGLTPNTRYYYTAHTGGESAGPFHFTTPSADREVSFRMIAVSDMQRDGANPEVWGNVIHDGILDFLAADAPLPDEALAFVLLPGDLVDDGNEHDRWIEEFFAPAADLASFVPFYPVLGNHEDDAHFYYDYFHMPLDGAPSDADKFWRMDHGNVRVIGLDSNAFFLLGEQQAFLEAALTDACTDEDLDFVFVEVHHGHHSELWPPGEAPFSTAVVERVDAFSRDCGRPGVLFYGHTHGYARSASRDAAHLWINVASAGGNIDYWGEYDDQYDDPETQVSQDDWGFVVMDVTAGDDPSLRVRRLSLGDETTPRDNEVRDEMIVRRYDEAPSTPVPSLPRGLVATTCRTLTAGDFSDPDGDDHGMTHWQVSTSCDAFDAPVFESYRAFENQYGGEDLAVGDDLRDEPAAGLSLDTYYCWRVRYRDRALAWSAWSTPVAFQLDASGASSCDDPTLLTPPEPMDDAGPDAGTTEPSGGCGCRASRRDGGGLVAALALMLSIAVRRRR